MVFPVDRDIRGLAVSPDGSLIMCMDNYGVRLWDSATGREIEPLWQTKWGDGKPLAAFSPDCLIYTYTYLPHTYGDWFPSGPKHLIHSYDVATGRENVILKAPIEDNEVITSITSSPCGSTIASGSSKGLVRLWDTATGVCRTILRDPEDPQQSDVSVAYSPDGRYLAAAYAHRIVRIWDLISGVVIQSLPDFPNGVSPLAYSPDGSRLVPTPSHRSVQIWNTSTFPYTASITLDHPTLVTAVAFAPDSLHLATGCLDGIVRIWDLTTSSCVATFEGHTQEVKGVAFAYNGSRLVTVAPGDAMRVWDVSSRTDGTATGTGDRETLSIALSRDGRSVASLDGGDCIRVQEVRSGSSIRDFQISSWRDRYGAYDCLLAFSADDSFLAYGSFGGCQEIWDLGTGQKIWDDEEQDKYGHPQLTRREVEEMTTSDWEHAASGGDDLKSRPDVGDFIRKAGDGTWGLVCIIPPTLDMAMDSGCPIYASTKLDRGRERIALGRRSGQDVILEIQHPY